MEVRYECMRPAQIIERRTEYPLVYVPLGTIEWHGPQNPTGLDGLKAHALAVRAAEQGGGLVFPVVWYGEHRESHLMEVNKGVGHDILDRMELPPENFSPGYTRSGTIIDQATDYVRLLWKIACQVHALGFSTVIFFNGHYPLTHYGQFIAHLVERHLGMKVWAGHEGQILPGHGDHAGIWETSLMMAASPELVDVNALIEAGEAVGCGPDPQDASAEQGEEWSRQIVDALVAKAHELLGPE
jgi:creatinine amidohydrolase